MSIHFINPLLTRITQDFDFKSHLRVWKPLLSSKCSPLGHCYYYMLICIYIFSLKAALYFPSPICFSSWHWGWKQRSTRDISKCSQLSPFLLPSLSFSWFFSDYFLNWGASRQEIPEKIVLKSIAKNIRFAWCWKEDKVIPPVHFSKHFWNPNKLNFLFNQHCQVDGYKHPALFQ